MSFCENVNRWDVWNAQKSTNQCIEIISGKRKPGAEKEHTPNLVYMDWMGLFLFPLWVKTIITVMRQQITQSKYLNEDFGYFVCMSIEQFDEVWVGLFYYY